MNSDPTPRDGGRLATRDPEQHACPYEAERTAEFRAPAPRELPPASALRVKDAIENLELYLQVSSFTPDAAEDIAVLISVVRDHGEQWAALEALLRHADLAGISPSTDTIRAALR